MTPPEQDASPGPASIPAAARLDAPAPRRPRARRLRDRVALGWLAAAVVIAIVHRWVPSATWLMIHLVLLGALTHSAMVWSEHFAHTLLHTVPDEAGRRRQDVRIGLLGVGALMVFLGVPLDAEGPAMEPLRATGPSNHWRIS